MKKIILLITLLPAISFAETIVLKADSWCPYNCERGSSKPGYIIEAVKEIFSEKNIQVEYKITDWDKAISEAKSGKINGIIGAAKQDAPWLVFPSVSQGMCDYHVWTRKDSKYSYKGVNSLRNIKLGIVSSYGYNKELNAYIDKNPNLIHSEDGTDPVVKNLRKMMSGEIDAVLADKNVVRFLSKKMKIESRIKSAGTVNLAKKECTLYVAFSPQDENTPRYMQILSEGWSKLRSTGKLKNILEKYNLSDWKQKQ